MKFTAYKLLPLILIILGLYTLETKAQLGFCTGSSGDPIFMEDFGTGLTDGPALPLGTTTYNFTSGAPDDGYYTLSSTTNYFDWYNAEDHTPGDNNGKSFIVNASFTAGEFYRRQVSGLCENTTYEFSAWLLNLLLSSSCDGNGIPVNVRFQIWDETDTNLLAQGDTGNIINNGMPEWNQYALVFQTLPGQTSVILKMRNNSNGGCGNDLAIDDIVFKSCGDSVNVATIQNEESIVVCEDQGAVGATLKATPDFSIFTTHAYQWQQSDDEIVWTDIVGENNTTYTTPLINNTSFYRVKIAEDAINVSNDLCNILSDVFEIKIVPIPVEPTSNGNVTICENDTAILSVSTPNGYIVNWYDAPTGGNLLQENSPEFSTTQAGAYYAESNTDEINCPSANRTVVTVTINPLPVVTDESIVFCEGDSATLSAGVDNVTYLWNTGEITKQILVDTEGNYTVVVTDTNGCSNTKYITLEQIDLPIIASIKSDGQGIIVTTANEGNFEYSIDGSTFQDSPIFEIVSGGNYIIYVRDKNRCSVVTQLFLHVVVPNFFTPNGDSRNDVFKPEGIESFSNINISIFDRYGKLVKYGNNQNTEWDGTSNGQPMPVNDYWYVLQIDTTVLKGHFTLKR
ncbi:T9SS type B sorting domain-containing protein [Maribacter sp. CXY002]|uniref:T9SS type B sorting domain-containing protein n=1 Tax=Maribacter luteocoastalis TaxID=3407671 RepID=UPI003B680377